MEFIKMNDIILDAIKNKKCLQFNYHGFTRFVEPHTYGKSTRWNDVLSAWQSQGGSRRGGIPDWRLFDVSEINGLQIANESFATVRPGYKRGDSRMPQIYSQL
jgi:hypothetical protein